MSQDLNQVLGDIDKLILEADTNKYWNDGDYLTKAVVKLSILNSYLGPHVAEAFDAANKAEAVYKVKRERLKLDTMKKGKTASESDSVKVVDTEAELQAWNKAQYNYKVLSIKRADTSEVIDGMRSRASRLSKEMEQLRTNP